MAITNATSTPEIQDILRLSARQLAEVLEWIQKGVKPSVPQERRKAPRMTWSNVLRLCVLLENEHKGRRTYALAPRNLSRLGTSLLHGKFVYGGTNCVVGLRALDGQIVPARGKVIWCRLITGRVHELGVQFDDPIEVEEFAAA